MITGDRNLLREGSDAHARFALQRDAVERLDVVYFGRGALFDALRLRGAYDVVTSQDPLWRGLVAYIVARKLGATLNVQVHMDLSVLPLMRRALARFVLRRADTVRVVSQKLKQQVGRMGIRAKVTVLPVFVDASRFTQIVRKPHSGKQILWVGRFEEEKNPKAAIDVLRDVLKVIPDVRLIMLGTGTMSHEVSTYAANLPINADVSVQYGGWQDPCPYLETADVLLSTSWHESWGSVFVEALAAGVPVIAPDVGIAKEAGAVVVPREKLALAVIEMLRSGARGKLALALLPADAWAVEWRNSLI